MKIRQLLGSYQRSRNRRAGHITVYDDAVLADGPIGYWKHYELTPPPAAPNTSFTDTADSHVGSLFPNSDGGLIQGITGPILTDPVSYGMSGGIARVPGTGGADGTDLDIRDDMTWEVWFKHVSVPGPSGVAATISTFINRGGDVTGTYLSTGQRSTGLFADQLYWSLLFDVAGTLTSYVVKSCEIPRDPDIWYCGQAVRKANEQWLYLNGWLVDYRNDLPTGPILPNGFSTTNLPWRFGYITNAAFGFVSRSQGQSCAALYNKALTQAQLRAHIVAALGSLPDNPCGVTPTITVGCPNATGTVGHAYSSEVTVTGGTPPYTFAVISGALPDGLSLDPSTGAITGTPTVANSFSFTIGVTDSDGLTGTSSGCSIVIAAEPPPPFIPPSGTFTVGFNEVSGLGIKWYLVPSITDSGVELRDKVVKSVRVTGKTTSANVQVHGWQPTQSINVTDLEDGLNPLATIPLEDTTEVVQSQRFQVNCPNLAQHTVRVEGEWNGQGIPDRVDEVITELAQQGIRR